MNKKKQALLLLLIMTTIEFYHFIADCLCNRFSNWNLRFVICLSLLLSLFTWPLFVLITMFVIMLWSLLTIMNLQVRSRAVTSEKYICSSEDILKYASKLLKAELPISLRLMGKNSHYGLYSLSSEGENELFCVLIHVSLSGSFLTYWEMYLDGEGIFYEHNLMPCRTYKMTNHFICFQAYACLISMKTRLVPHLIQHKKLSTTSSCQEIYLGKIWMIQNPWDWILMINT